MKRSFNSLSFNLKLDFKLILKQESCVKSGLRLLEPHLTFIKN